MKRYIGIEFGSTRIKTVMIDEKGKVESSRTYTWENKLENGFWTYSEKEIWEGIRNSVSELVKRYGKESEICGLGISGMMHGYIALDKSGKMLVPSELGGIRIQGKLPQN